MSTAMITDARPVKVNLGEELRRFAFEGISFFQLQQNIAQLYNIQRANFIVRYQDNENDWININSDKELAVAFQLVPSGSTLRLSVTLENGALMEASPKEVPIVSPVPVNPPTYSTSSNPPLYPIPSYPPLYTEVDVVNVPPQMGFPVASPTPTPTSTPFLGHQNRKEWKQSFKQAKMIRKQEKLQRKIERKSLKFEKKLEHIQEKALKHGVARLVQETTIPAGPIAPGSEALKIWRLRNESLVAWSEDCMLVFRKGEALSPLEAVKLPKVVAPGEECEISVSIRAPQIPGLYMSVWKLVSGPNGRPFGRPFHIKVWVCDPNTQPPTPSTFSNDFDGYLAQLAAMGFADHQLNERLLRKCNHDMDKVVWKLLKKQAKLQRKLQKVRM